MGNEKKLNDLRETLGKHIQKLRKERHITQEQLAEKAGLPLTSIAYIETGYN